MAIVGGGLAGLCCARRLMRGGVDVRLFEAADRLGGRVASDRVDGFIVDRGFQVLLTAYPEARSGLDLERLRLHRFYSGALVYCDGRLRRLADPRRHPLAGLRSALSPLLTFRDLPRLALLRTRLQRIADGMRPAEDVATGEYLRRSGFSERAIERFFRPFFGGVFLERELDTPLAKFAFVFTMFARGPAALPEGGIAAISAQVAEELLLTRLSEQDVAKLLEGRAGRPPPAELVKLVYSETEGNAFFVEEVFRHLHDAGKLFDEQFRQCMDQSCQRHCGGDYQVNAFNQCYCEGPSGEE